MICANSGIKYDNESEVVEPCRECEECKKQRGNPMTIKEILTKKTFEIADQDENGEPINERKAVNLSDALASIDKIVEGIDNINKFFTFSSYLYDGRVVKDKLTELKSKITNKK